jgi:hypothetical protein
MSAHCSTCSCKSEPVPPPATSHEWARRAALEAAAAAVRAAKDARKKPAEKETSCTLEN